MLQINNLEVSYGNVTAVRGISIDVADNEIVSLIGANGAGKSSTLMAISNLVPKTNGNIIFKGQDITDMRADKIVNLGIAHVPEGRHVFPKLSVRDNLFMGSLPAGNISKKELEERIEAQYALFPRLKERRNQMAGTLSGGEQQMLAICRGLISDPSLIMLDEPSLGLAPIVVEEIFELILKVRDQGKTILLVEQNAAMALQICDHAYTLELGTIAIKGTGKELLESDEVRRAYLGM